MAETKKKVKPGYKAAAKKDKNKNPTLIGRVLLYLRSFFNTSYRTYLGTSSAIDTFFMINYSEIMLNVYCVIGAGFLALAATDTTVGASLASNCTLVVIGAKNGNP